MKHGTLLISVLIGLALCSLTANVVYDQKVSLLPYEAKSPVQFYAGMDKFLSNVAWMTLVQWEAQGTTDTDTQRAEALYNKLNALTNLDPLFGQAYLDGALSIMRTRPDLAAALLEKGSSLGLENNWKLEFYAGLVQLEYKHDPKQAEIHWGIARTLPDAPFYVETAWMRSRSEQLGGDRMGVMNMWYTFYNGLNAENKSRQMERSIAASYISDIGDELVADCDGKLTSSDLAPQARVQILDDRKKAMKMLDDIKPKPATEPSAHPSV